MAQVLKKVSANDVRHNIAGQRLGKKGQETRQRILNAALRLLADDEGPAVNFTNIAREASVRITNLYLYFPDFGDLILAALNHVMEEADDAFVHLLHFRWPDEDLQQCALDFLRAHHKFWSRHSRLLHIRNQLSDEDPRILSHRQNMTIPQLQLLAAQMDCPPETHESWWDLMATVVLTGLERVATLVTAPYFKRNLAMGMKSFDGYVDALLQTEARLLQLAIQDTRAQLGAESRLPEQVKQSDLVVGH